MNDPRRVPPLPNSIGDRLPPVDPAINPQVGTLHSKGVLPLRQNTASGFDDECRVLLSLVLLRDCGRCDMDQAPQYEGRSRCDAQCCLRYRLRIKLGMGPERYRLTDPLAGEPLASVCARVLDTPENIGPHKDYDERAQQQREAEGPIEERF